MACNSGTHSVQMGSYNKPENCISGTSASSNQPKDYNQDAQEAACSGGCFAVEGSDS